MQSPASSQEHSPDRRSGSLRWGSLQLGTRYLLAPLAGYTNLAFRLAVRELGGVGLATTDLVNARALLRQSRKALELVQTCPADRPLAVQIYGTEVGPMTAAAQWLEDYGVSSIDINMGCPVHKVTRGGGGSALMCNTSGTIGLVKAIVESVRIPVSVKMRLGWDDQSLSAPFFARAFEDVGVAAVIVHGRTRQQGFGGSVSRAGIRAVVEAVSSIPVIGNGDVRTVAEASRMFAETGCAGIAIGRGALLNPWIFQHLQTWESTGEHSPSAAYEQRLDFMARHLSLQVEERGEEFGCRTFRKVARWYCKVLKPGRELHQRLMLLDSVASFDAIVAALRERGEPPGWSSELSLEAPVSVPLGPVEHW